MSLAVFPITLKQANQYVYEHHRHNIPTNGHKWSICCKDENGKIHGVAICGHPIARRIDDGETIEVRRCCTDGYPNACSFLYGACARIAKEFGYRRIITYTLQSEPGTSLKASGWDDCGEAGGTSWNVPSSPREETQITLFGETPKYPTEKKRRWEKKFERVWRK